MSVGSDVVGKYSYLKKIKIKIPRLIEFFKRPERLYFKSYPKSLNIFFSLFLKWWSKLKNKN